ncbi:hypothetical protein FRB99_005291 [Tulasnella sp. 403]|nr:hypothetical protein FRB99_005291 [Tulasnella sp. 403]
MSQSLSTATPIQPPEPLKADSEPAPPLDHVLAKKRSFNPFKSSSSHRRRRKSRISSSSTENLEANSSRANRPGPSSTGRDALGPHIVNGRPLDEPQLVATSSEDITEIALPDSIEGKDETVDIYRWAVLYENQRGFTMFSMPFYGYRSLLPNDPAPFTIPVSSGRLTPEESRQAMLTPCTLRDYQLPDAKWQWVSKYWMVDMRGDGEVCASGFEYNWAFRSKGWRPHPGTLSAGAWVRRRRWVRLMMRPADRTPTSEESPTQSGGIKASDSRATVSNRTSITPRSSIFIDPNHSSSDLGESEESALGNTWRGDPEADWDRCRRVMRHFGRDGRKLELWRDWLGLSLDSKLRPGLTQTSLSSLGKAKDKAMFSESEIVSSPLSVEHPDDACFTPHAPMANRAYVLPVIRGHGAEIVASFIFPDSRSRFLALLKQAEIDSEVIRSISPCGSTPEFWSRRSRITEVTETETPPPGPRSEEKRPRESSDDDNNRTDWPKKKVSTGKEEVVAAY